MPVFWGDNKALQLAARKSVDCMIPLKDRDRLTQQSVILIEQSVYDIGTLT